MVEHILLAQQVGSEADISVVEKAISFVLKGDESSKLFASEDYIALRKDAVSGLPSRRTVCFSSFKVSIHPSKDTRVTDCIIALSFINPNILPARCSQPAAAVLHRSMEVVESDVCR